MNDLNRNCTNMKILWKYCWKEWKWQLQAHLPSFQSQFNFNENVPPPNTQVSGHQSTQQHFDNLTWQTIIILTSQKIILTSWQSNKTSYFLDIKNNHQLANQAPAGPPIPTSAASRYPPPSSQQRNPQFTSLEVIIIKMSLFPCCWLYHFPSSGGETSWGRRCRVDFSTNPSVRFSPLQSPQRNPFPPRKRAPTSGSKSWGPERLMTDQWKQGLANIFGHN